MLISLLITILIVALVFSLVWMIVQLIPLPPPMAQWIRIIIAVIGLLVLIDLLLPYSHWHP